MQERVGVLFDLYGTLLIYGDMQQAWSDWIEDMRFGLNRLGLILSPQEASLACDGFFSGALKPISGLTVYETRIHLLAMKLGANPGTQWCGQMARSTLERWQSYITLDPDALSVLSELKSAQIRIGVLSNFDHYPHIYEVLQATGLAPYMDATVISGEVGLKKPDKAIFALGVSSLGTDAKRTFFIGDHPELDFDGAENAGLQAILLMRGAKGLDRLHTNYRADQISAPEANESIQSKQTVASLYEAANVIYSAVF